VEVLRYAAFSDDPAGGNPAGVVLDAGHADEAEMQRVAAEVGFSETAFLLPDGPDRFAVRYFSPRAEVAFCGHATIASAVAWGERHGPGTLHFDTPAGPIVVGVTREAGQVLATLTSVPPRTASIDPTVVSRLLAALRWSAEELDPTLPVRAAFAGVWHPVVAVAARQVLGALDYDYAALDAVTAEQGWTTVACIHRRDARTFDVRNPFPAGGVVEDPATGAAAAALGGYLRELGLVDVPAELTVHQGDDMGRPSLLTVRVPAGAGGIEVGGTAVPLD
jgi:PhzF family phenazine biosynthesis protein